MSCDDIIAEYIHVVPANLGFDQYSFLDLGYGSSDSSTKFYNAHRLSLSELKVFSETEVGAS